jgi:chromosome segregation and condensation protein ScpB
MPVPALAARPLHSAFARTLAHTTRSWIDLERQALVRVVGQTCRFDDLIADLTYELRGRPYDLVLVAGGYALRTKTRFAAAVRAANPGGLPDDGLADLTRTETFALTAIAYLQPVTRGRFPGWRDGRSAATSSLPSSATA